ncbi:opsin-5-like [Lytechinus pictus]|uniref:opsin-5-like n=1 Tax=Lytechinus pictus TaxID=7653 RepID=UPI0030B9F3F1
MDLDTERWTNDTPWTRKTLSDDPYTSVLSHKGDICAGVYLVFISLIACIGNVSVIVISLRKRDKLKPIDLLTINLAVADFLISVASYPLPTISAFRHKWSFGRNGCIWYGFSGFLFAVASMATLTAIALFRYLKLCRENVDQYNSRPFVIKVIIAIWAFSLFVTTPPLCGWSSYVPEPYRLSCTINFADTSSASLSYTYFTIIAVFLAPLGVIVACYVAIARKMIHHNRRINVIRNAGRILEVRLLKTACAITSAYILSWTPYTIIAVWVTFRPVTQIPAAFRILPAFCAKTSSVYNPIIYCIFNKSFRQEVNSFVCCCACQCYKISVNLDMNSHAQRQFRRIESKRGRNITSRQRPLMIYSSPSRWHRDLYELWRKRIILVLNCNCKNNDSVENINVTFRRDNDMGELNISTAEVHCLELNTAMTRGKPTVLPVLDEVPSETAHCSSHLPGSLDGSLIQYHPQPCQPSTSTPADEFLNPSGLVSRNRCVIMVRPTIEEELSSDF